MGCLASKITDKSDHSGTWTNIETTSKLFVRTGNDGLYELDEINQNEVSGTKKRLKMYFEPCLLYIHEPGHDNYHLNDLGLYEQDIEFTIESKTTTHKKRPDGSGLLTDNTFDETKYNVLEKFSLLRPKEIYHHEACVLVNYSDFEGQTRCNNLTTIILMLATDHFLLQRVLPNENISPKLENYNGVFHCRLCRFGVWEDVYIDDRLSVGSAGLICGSPDIKDCELWIPLIEKSYAQFWGNYDKLKTHRYLEIFRTLTGGTVEEIKLSERRYDSFYISKRIHAALQQRSWILCTVSQKHHGTHNLIGGQVFIVKSVSKVTTKKSTEVPLVKLRNLTGLTEWSGPWHDQSTEWETVTCMKDTEVCDNRSFYMSVECFIKYMECITICNLIPEQDKLSSEQRSNYITKIYSEWKGTTAAGLNYLKNPKYLIKISEKGIEKDGKIRIVIILEQITSHVSSDLVAIRVKLYKVHVDCEKGLIVEDLQEEGICSSKISVSISHRIVPGQYLIVPHTDREDIEKEFMIAVYAPTPLPGVSYLNNSKPVLVTKQEADFKTKTVKPKLSLTNYKWGIWNLTKGNMQGEEFDKNPQFEITIPNEGSTSCVVRFQLLKDSFQKEACIGFRLFKLNSKREMPLNKTFIDAIWGDPVKCHDGSIEGWQWNDIAPTYILDPGTYVAIAWADKAEYKCSFCLVVRVSMPITIKSYNEAGHIEAVI